MSILQIWAILPTQNFFLDIPIVVWVSRKICVIQKAITIITWMLHFIKICYQRFDVAMPVFNQGIIFEASDRSRSLSLAQINNLGSDLSLTSIAKIARCMQVFVLYSLGKSTLFIMKCSDSNSQSSRIRHWGWRLQLHQDCKNAIEATMCWPRGL